MKVSLKKEHIIHLVSATHFRNDLFFFSYAKCSTITRRTLHSGIIECNFIWKNKSEIILVWFYLLLDNRWVYSVHKEQIFCGRWPVQAKTVYFRRCIQRRNKWWSPATPALIETCAGHVNCQIEQEMRHFVIYNLEHQTGRVNTVYFGFILYLKSNIFKLL